VCGVCVWCVWVCVWVKLLFVLARRRKIFSVGDDVIKRNLEIVASRLKIRQSRSQ